MQDLEIIKYEKLVKLRAEVLLKCDNLQCTEIAEIGLNSYKKTKDENMFEAIQYYLEELDSKTFHSFLFTASFDIAEKYKINPVDLYHSCVAMFGSPKPVDK